MKSLAIVLLILQLALSQFGSHVNEWRIFEEIFSSRQEATSSGGLQNSEAIEPGIQYDDGDITIIVPEGQDTFGG